MQMSMPNSSCELRKLVLKISGSKDKRKQYICLSQNGEVLINEAFKAIG